MSEPVLLVKARGIRIGTVGLVRARVNTNTKPKHVIHAKALGSIRLSLSLATIAMLRVCTMLFPVPSAAVVAHTRPARQWIVGSAVAQVFIVQLAWLPATDVMDPVSIDQLAKSVVVQAFTNFRSVKACDTMVFHLASGDGTGC
ncbi:hypothetical protein D3C79_557510 [compost metagenome]